MAISRYFALYLVQAGWVLVGAALFIMAEWPSSCAPSGFIKLYECSIHLPDNRGWVEAALMTWLWATPLLVALELSRRLRGRR